MIVVVGKTYLDSKGNTVKIVRKDWAAYVSQSGAHFDRDGGPFDSGFDGDTYLKEEISSQQILLDDLEKSGLPAVVREQHRQEQLNAQYRECWQAYDAGFKAGTLCPKATVAKIARVQSAAEPTILGPIHNPEKN